MAHALAQAAGSGLVLGRYRPLRPLGSGSSGSVWHALDEATGTEVALKIVAREGKAAARAEREASAATRLRHPRCQRAYALAHDDDHVYIAYEYVPGRTLRDALRAGAIDDATAVEVAAQVLDGLAHAHARRIVHRDVKPSNILLADGEGVSVRILDFGLAQMDAAETLTAVGDVPGTLAYIAPERLAGADATPASDVWAVGVLLWEALAGLHPFWKPSLLESARAIEAGAPPLRTVRPDLPRPLHEAVDRALSPSPGRRPRAERLAHTLRTSLTRPRPRPPAPAARSVRRPVVPAAPRRTLTGRRALQRATPAAVAAVAAGWGAGVLPFFPAGWPVAVALLAAAATVVRERAGLAVVLAAPVLPLGNVSSGLAAVYAAVALAWLLAFRREPRAGLLVAAGPALGWLSALALLPAAALWVRSAHRRALAVAGAVVVAGVAAALRGAPLPLTAERPPGLDLAGTESARRAGAELAGALAAVPALAALVLALAAAAAFLPLARRAGPWAIAGWGATTLALTLLPPPEVAAGPVVAGVWATCAALWSEPYARAALERRRAS